MPQIKLTGIAYSDNHISLWLPERQMYINEFIRLEGRGKHAEDFCQCCAQHAVFRCQDCFSVGLTCPLCTIQLHRCRSGKMAFHSVSRKSMGLHVQLGHNPGTPCRRPKSAYGDNFVVIDVHRIHEISLNFCGCEHEFPSTLTDSRTATTFAILGFFHLLSFKLNISAYEFYHFQDYYCVFLRMVAKWRNSISLKHSGCEHGPASIHSLQDGVLAMLYPACPHPGKNLPDSWETASDQWKYGLFLAVDANFPLKHQMVSSDKKDPALSKGWGYFVDETDYKYYLNINGGMAQEFLPYNTVNMADTKSLKGLAATGVGTVDCAQYDMKMANVRYTFSFWSVFPSAFQFLALQRINISYDITCQWHKKLWPHSYILPSSLHFNRERKVIKFSC
ncbi:hypothetical protein P692DRAFT_201841354 [Suillus brevipes Sb2]|nr:hypothetical protein P692DRAFT_201841354 [Suillus brevipes Sb2]